MKKIAIYLILSFLFAFWTLSFLNQEHSIEAQYRERQDKIKDSIENKESRSNIQKSNDFEMYNFKNMFELPIPKPFKVTQSDSISVSFQIPKEHIGGFENMTQSQIVITIQPKRSNLSQNSVVQASTDMLEKMRELNEKIMKHLLPTFIGWEEFQVENTTISTGTNNFGYNYILTDFIFDVKGKKFYSKLYLYPLENKIIRVQYYFIPRSKDKITFSAINTNLFE